MALELFRAQAKSFTPRISINPAGQIGFNRGAVHAFDLSGYDRVRLLFDRESMIIALNPVLGEHDDAVTLRKGKGGVGISARRFLQYYRVMPERTMLFPVRAATHPEYGKLLVIKLREGIIRGPNTTRVVPRTDQAPPTADAASLPQEPALSGGTPEPPPPPPPPTAPSAQLAAADYKMPTPATRSPAESSRLINQLMSNLRSGALTDSPPPTKKEES